MMCVFTEEEEARIATDEQKNLPKTSLFFGKNTMTIYSKENYK